MTMHESQGWLLDSKTVWIVLSAFGAAVLLHALWRSRGAATPDPIRESGPIC
jgi:hypothetical protein